VVLILVQFLLVWKHARRKPKRERVKHVFEELEHWSMLLTTLRTVLVLAPPIFYSTIFLPCWECYDFEGAAAHEIGHVLGLRCASLIMYVHVYVYVYLYLSIYLYTYIHIHMRAPLPTRSNTC